MEWFLSTEPSGYWHFATDIYNQRYEGKGYNGTLNVPWESRIIMKKDCWIVLAKIPFTSIGLKADSEHVLAMFVRETTAKAKSGRSEFSSWNGGMVHQPAGFGKIILGK